MKIFFDTSVLVAASVRSHVHHVQALPALQKVIANKERGFFGLHSIAEVFSALTRIPAVPRIHPAEANRIIEENFLPHFEIVPVSKSDYLEAMNLTANGGWIGGKIYDALLLCCAAKVEVDRIYTFNLNDFQRLAPALLKNKICAPR
jgi:predicted nucleic acid-binding protein